MNSAESFVADFSNGIALAKARKMNGVIGIDDTVAADYVVLVFTDGSRAGYKRGNGRKASQAWHIAPITD